MRMQAARSNSQHRKAGTAQKACPQTGSANTHAPLKRSVYKKSTKSRVEKDDATKSSSSSSATTAGNDGMPKRGTRPPLKHKTQTPVDEGWSVVGGSGGATTRVPLSKKEETRLEKASQASKRSVDDREMGDTNPFAGLSRGDDADTEPSMEDGDDADDDDDSDIGPAGDNRGVPARNVNRSSVRHSMARKELAKLRGQPKKPTKKLVFYDNKEKKDIATLLTTELDAKSVPKWTPVVVRWLEANKMDMMSSGDWEATVGLNGLQQKAIHHYFKAVEKLAAASSSPNSSSSSRADDAGKDEEDDDDDGTDSGDSNDNSGDDDHLSSDDQDDELSDVDDETQPPICNSLIEDKTKDNGDAVAFFNLIYGGKDLVKASEIGPLIGQIHRCLGQTNVTIDFGKAVFNSFPKMFTRHRLTVMTTIYRNLTTRMVKDDAVEVQPLNPAPVVDPLSTWIKTVASRLAVSCLTGVVVNWLCERVFGGKYSALVGLFVTGLRFNNLPFGCGISTLYQLYQMDGFEGMLLGSKAVALKTAWLLAKHCEEKWRPYGSTRFRASFLVFALAFYIVSKNADKLAQSVKNNVTLFQPRGAARLDAAMQPVLGAVNVLEESNPTTLDRPELQNVTCAVQDFNVVELRGANLYTWWHNIPPDSVDATGRKLWLVETDRTVKLPSTFLADTSAFMIPVLTKDVNLTPAVQTVLAGRLAGIRTGLAIPANVKDNISSYGVLIAAYHAMPKVRLAKPEVTMMEKAMTVLGLGSVVDTLLPSENPFNGPQGLLLKVAFGSFFPVIFSPVVEEAIRSWLPRLFTAYLICAEQRRAYLSSGWSGFRWQLCASTMHLLMCWVVRKRLWSYWKRVGFHAVYNSIVMFVQRDTVMRAIDQVLLEHYPHSYQSNYLHSASFFGFQQIWGLWKTLKSWLLGVAPAMKNKPSGVHRLKQKFPECPNVEKPVTALQVQYGLTSESYRPVVYANNRHNAEVSLKQRVLYDEVGTDAPEVCATRAEFVEFCTANNGKLLKDLFEPCSIRAVSFPTYLERSNASPGVKRKIQLAYDNLKEIGISRGTPLTKGQIHNWTRLSCFVKVENLNYRTEYGEKVKAPRMIMGSRPEFLAIVGPWMMAVSDHIKSKMDGSNGFLFTSGCTAKQASEYLGDGDGFVCEETDVAHWDRSIHRDIRQLELSLFKMFKPPVAVLQLLKEDANQTRGVTASGLAFSMRTRKFGKKIRLVKACQRPSGRPDTSLSNTFINMLIRIWGYCLTWGLPFHMVRAIVRVLLQGDDGASHSPASLPRVNWRDVFARAGFDLEYKLVRGPTYLSFCSMLNYPVAGGHCFGPKVGRILGKTCFALDPHEKIDLKQVARGICLGLAAPATFIRPLQMWVDRLLELCGEGDVINWHREEWQMEFSSATPDATTATFLNERYGWCPAMETMFAQELKANTFGGGQGGVVYNHLICVDTDGPVVLPMLDPG